MIVNILKHQNINLQHKNLGQNFYSCELVPLRIACDGTELSLHHLLAHIFGQQRLLLMLSESGTDET